MSAEPIPTEALETQLRRYSVEGAHLRQVLEESRVTLTISLENWREAKGNVKFVLSQIDRVLGTAHLGVPLLNERKNLKVLIQDLAMELRATQTSDGHKLCEFNVHTAECKRREKLLMQAEKFQKAKV